MSPSEAEITQQLVALVVEAGEGRLRPESIDIDGHLYDCGYLDSLSSAAFLKALQARWGVTLKESQLVGRLDTVRALAEHVGGAG